MSVNEPWFCFQNLWGLFPTYQISVLSQSFCFPSTHEVNAAPAACFLGSLKTTLCLPPNVLPLERDVCNIAMELTCPSFLIPPSSWLGGDRLVLLPHLHPFAPIFCGLHLTLLEEDSFFLVWTYTARDTEGIRTVFSDAVMTHNNSENASHHEFLMLWHHQYPPSSVLLCRPLVPSHSQTWVEIITCVFQIEENKVSLGIWSLSCALIGLGLSSLTDFSCMPQPLHTLPPCTLCWDTHTTLHWNNVGKIVKHLGCINQEVKEKLLLLTLSACHLLHADDMSSP